MTNSKKKIKTIMGITNPSMNKFLDYVFGLDFHDCKIDQNRCCFVAYISESVPNDKTNDFRKHWDGYGVTIHFLRIKEEKKA